MKMDIEVVESFIIDTKTRLAKMNNNSRREKKTVLKWGFFWKSESISRQRMNRSVNISNH